MSTLSIYARVNNDGLWIEESAVCDEHKMESPLTVDSARGPVKRVRDDLYFCCCVCGKSAGDEPDPDPVDEPAEQSLVGYLLTLLGAAVIGIYLLILMVQAAGNLSAPALPNAPAPVTTVTPWGVEQSGMLGSPPGECYAYGPGADEAVCWGESTRA